MHKFLYKILKLYLGFPKRLLHLPTHLGGFGDLCTYVQTTKYSIMCRHLRADSSEQHSIDSLLTRAHSINGSPIQPGTPVIIPFPTNDQIQPSSSVWITSLLQFLQRHNLQLARGGHKFIHGPDEPLMEYLLRLGYSSHHLRSVLCAHSVHTVSDAFHRQTARWSPGIKHLLHSLNPITPIPDLPSALSPSSLRIG